jgi:hypothetical protein
MAVKKLGLVSVLGLFLTLIWLGAVGPLAVMARPVNDDFDDATVIAALPFTDVTNTSDATTAADDPDCFGQGPTVWYAFTPGEDVRLEANTFGSEYDTTLSVYVGERGNLEQIDCNDDTFSLQSRVRFDAQAGETYYFMVGAWGSGPGGHLVFNLDVAPPPAPPLEVTFSIDPVGSVVPSIGEATISGTVTCSRDAFVEINGRLQQRIGRVFITGFFFQFVECSGETPWSTTLIGDNGLFTGGKANVEAFWFAFDDEEFDFVFGEESQDVRLTGAKQPKGPKK